MTYMWVVLYLSDCLYVIWNKSRQHKHFQKLRTLHKAKQIWFSVAVEDDQIFHGTEQLMEKFR